MEKYVKVEALPLLFRRWWLKVREVGVSLDSNGLKHATHEFYVPWYAQPLEILHGLLFGKTTLVRCDNEEVT